VVEGWRGWRGLIALEVGMVTRSHGNEESWQREAMTTKSHDNEKSWQREVIATRRHRLVESLCSDGSVEIKVDYHDCILYVGIGY
jgi:hypothetical protein